MFCRDVTSRSGCVYKARACNWIAHLLGSTVITGGGGVRRGVGVGGGRGGPLYPRPELRRRYRPWDKNGLGKDFHRKLYND